MLAIGSAVAQGGTKIAGIIGGHNDAVDQARAQNQARMDQYKYQLQIRDKQYKDTQQIYATKWAQYNRQLDAADRAASQAYGREQWKQSQRLKQAAFQGLRLNTALATNTGSAAASGKTGRAAQRIDSNLESAFVRNQNMILQNLMTAEETRGFREQDIANNLESFKNRAYGQVAVAPTKPLPLLEPTQLAGPSTAGRNLGILNAGIGMASGIAGAFAPNPGDLGTVGTEGFNANLASDFASRPWNNTSIVGNPYQI